MSVLGSHIRQVREGLGLSLAELATRSGLSAPFLSDFERGNRTARPQTLKRIALALGISDSEIRRVEKESKRTQLLRELQELGDAR